MNESCIFVRHKNRWKHNQHFKAAVFHYKFTICHINPNIYIKKTKFASHKQYLFPLITCINTKKTQNDQTIPRVFFAWKETTHKPLNVAAAKSFFSIVYVTDTNYFDECFLFFVMIGRHYLSWKFNVTLRLFLSAMVLFSLKPMFERGLHFMFYLHNNNTMLISKFQNKV